ncbi:MAG: L,D-transpeptidase family protein [Chitinophagaceae bacterium]
MKNVVRLLLLGSLFYLAGCRYFQNPKEDDFIDTTITPQTSYNNLFLDSNTIANFLSQHPSLQQYLPQYISFYKNRNYQYAWFDSTTIGEHAHNFINLLNSAIYQLEDSSLYQRQLWELYQKVADTSFTTAANTETVIKTELLFTGQFFDYAAKMYKGADIDATELGWFIPRKKIDLTALLDSTIKSKAKEPEKYVPLNHQFSKLQKYLTKYFAIKKWFNWYTDTVITAVKPYKLGDSIPTLINAKKRLYAFGDMPDLDTTAVYDSTLVKAVKQFQLRYGLPTTGTLGDKTIKELNDSIDNRIQTLLVNLERVRWMPPLPDTAHIVVNIPAYSLYVYDSGKQAFQMRVIVGSEANNTVIFSGNLRYVVFSPYWNVPPSIVEKEILPALKKDPNYLAKHFMEITGKKGKLPNIRQQPGPHNSLGLVKFLFPNNYNIYLHDTPNRNLFNERKRSLSHGCIRVGDPPKLANFLLRNDTTYTERKIDSLMHLKTEKWVTLPSSIKVFIGYFTAWVDEKDRLHFRKDIYRHDAKMAEKLFVKK